MLTIVRLILVLYHFLLKKQKTGHPKSWISCLLSFITFTLEYYFIPVGQPNSNLHLIRLVPTFPSPVHLFHIDSHLIRHHVVRSGLFLSPGAVQGHPIDHGTDNQFPSTHPEVQGCRNAAGLSSEFHWNA